MQKKKTGVVLDPKVIDNAVKLIRVLNKKRNQLIISLLIEGKLTTIGQLAKKMRVSNSTVSNHLSQLRCFNLVQSKNNKHDARTVTYTVNKNEIQRKMNFVRIVSALANKLTK